MVIININTEVADERIKDLLCNALEGGSNYWYVIKGYNYPEGQTKESLKLEFPHLDLPFDGGSLTIGVFGDNAYDKVLDKEALLKGLKIMARDYLKHYTDFISENDDAITGDVFLQCALYGEVIFS
jgi:hypothetical protein